MSSSNEGSCPSHLRPEAPMRMTLHMHGFRDLHLKRLGHGFDHNGEERRPRRIANCAIPEQINSAAIWRSPCSRLPCGAKRFPALPIACGVSPVMTSIHRYAPLRDEARGYRAYRPYGTPMSLEPPNAPQPAPPL